MVGVIFKAGDPLSILSTVTMTSSKSSEVRTDLEFKRTQQLKLQAGNDIFECCK